MIYGESYLGDSGLDEDMSATVGNAIGTERTSGPLNVVVSGKKRYNNKGEVVEQYEPFFSTGFGFGEEATQPGVAMKMYYDALGRLVKTKNPDDSEQRVYFGVLATIDQLESFVPTPWERYTYDANDLAGLTHPGGSYPTSHYYTPKSELIDALGRVIETTEHQAHYDAGAQEYQDVVMNYQYDIKGQLTQVTNANNVIQTINKFDTAGNQLFTNHIDRGIARLTVDAKGMPYFTTDAKGAATLSLYDGLDRPVKMWARDNGTDGLAVRNQTIFGDAAGLANPEAQNLKGKPYEVYDGSGKLTFNEYDFKGNLLEKTRQVIKDTLLTGQTKYAHAWNTLDVAKLDSTEFKTNSRYDALNRPVEVTYPQDMSGGRKKVHPEYNTAGALERLKFAGATAVSQIAYNAKGQRTMMVAGGLMTRYVYDSETFRLTRIRAEKFANSGVNYGPSGTPSVRLDRGYSYDLMGSVTGVHDKTPGDSASRGPNDKQWVYSHDPLRRLISATGRQQTDPGPVPPWQDINFTGSENLGTTNDYLREYKYDKQGNILELKHTAVGHLANGFTRYFNKANGYAGDNLLNSVTIGDPPNDVSYTYSYDANGNMIQENSDRFLEWNYADKLTFFKRQAGTGDPSVWVHYLYDNDGNRIKKIVNKTGGVQEVTVYIDGFYEYSYTKNSGSFDNNRRYNKLHIMDGTSKIATVRVGTDADADSAAIPTQLFYVEDHLGNSSVVVQTNGNRFNLEEYYPFGETSFGSYAKKRNRYNGKEKDEHTGLYEYGQRYYAPWLCRFVSVDPIAEDYPQLSSYNYAGNKPITHVDLEGLQSDGGDDQFVGPPEPDSCGTMCDTELAISQIYDSLNEGVDQLKEGATKTLNDIEFTYLGEGQWALGDTNVDLGTLYEIVDVVGNALRENYESIQNKAAQGKALKEQGFALNISVDLSGIFAEGMDELVGDGAEDAIRKLSKGKQRSFGSKAKGSASVNLIGQISSEGKVMLMVEASAGLEFGKKRALGVTIADVSTSAGIEYDFASGQADLFTSQGFYFFGWAFENTDRLVGGNEKELNLGVKLSAAGAEVEILLAIPEPPPYMKRAEGFGLGGSNQQVRRTTQIFLSREVASPPPRRWKYRQ